MTWFNLYVRVNWDVQLLNFNGRLNVKPIEKEVEGAQGQIGK